MKILANKDDPIRVIFGLYSCRRSWTRVARRNENIPSPCNYCIHVSRRDIVEQILFLVILEETYSQVVRISLEYLYLIFPLNFPHPFRNVKHLSRPFLSLSGSRFSSLGDTRDTCLRARIPSALTQ